MSSPPLVVTTHKGLEIVEDNVLACGTKQRAVLQYVRDLIRNNPMVETLIYTGGFNGYGPVNVAYAARECGLRCHLLLTTSRVGQGSHVSIPMLEREITIQKIRHYGAKVQFIKSWRTAVDEGRRLSAHPSKYWLPLGFKSSVFTAALTDALVSAARGRQFEHIVVAGGVGEIAKALRAAFKCRVTAVAVSSVAKLQKALEGTGIEVVPPLKIEIGEPPVPTVTGYDSHAYYVALAMGATWWNVAGLNRTFDIYIAPPATAVRCEEVRASTYRRSMANFCKRTTAQLCALAPDIFARLLFRSFIQQKTGDPLLLDERDWDTEAIAKHIRTRRPDLTVAVPPFSDILPRWRPVRSGACATIHDVPPHLVQLLRDKFVPDAVDFDTLAVCLYVRYMAIGAIGHQMAMPLRVKNYLVQTFAGNNRDNVIELFASAFNAGLPRFMSVFPDLEYQFGSIGTFNGALSGAPVFVANPPYDELMLTRMVDSFLQKAETSSDFTVLFGMPEWTDFPALDRLRQSPFVRIEVKFGNGDVEWMNIMGDNQAARIPAHSWFVVSTKKWPTSVGDEMARIWRS